MRTNTETTSCLLKLEADNILYSAFLPSRLLECSTALPNKDSLSFAAFPLKLICCAPTLAEIPVAIGMHLCGSNIRNPA